MSVNVSAGSFQGFVGIFSSVSISTKVRKNFAGYSIKKTVQLCFLDKKRLPIKTVF
jgi:hypothetical protein